MPCCRRRWRCSPWASRWARWSRPDCWCRASCSACWPSGGWCCGRRATGRPLQNGAGRGARAGLAAGLLAVAAVAGYAAGPHLPGADADARVVARSAVTPPFDVAQYPSPLAGYRRYTEPNPADLWDRDLLRVEGLPAGTPLRFATLDAYDGAVWGASNRANNGTRVAGAAFQQVGSRVATRGEGRPVQVRVTVPEDGYRDVWLPTAGTVTGIAFDGSRADQLASRLWLNVDTNTAIVPDRLAAGDSYTMEARLPDVPAELPDVGARRQRVAHARRRARVPRRQGRCLDRRGRRPLGPADRRGPRPAQRRGLHRRRRAQQLRAPLPAGTQPGPARPVRRHHPARRQRRAVRRRPRARGQPAEPADPRRHGRDHARERCRQGPGRARLGRGP